MVKLYQVETDAHKQFAQELFYEYLMWLSATAIEEYGIGDTEDETRARVAKDMKNLDAFTPPTGHLLLAEVGGQPAGIAGLRMLDDAICEIKRVYVKPDYRRLGLGKALLEALIARAKAKDMQYIRLDSARFLNSAHNLFRAFGFQDIEPYEDSEIPEEYWSYFLFMELKLR